MYVCLWYKKKIFKKAVDSWHAQAHSASRLNTWYEFTLCEHVYVWKFSGAGKRYFVTVRYDHMGFSIWRVKTFNHSARITHVIQFGFSFNKSIKFKLKNRRLQSWMIECNADVQKQMKQVMHDCYWFLWVGPLVACGLRYSLLLKLQTNICNKPSKFHVNPLTEVYSGRVNECF